MTLIEALKAGIPAARRTGQDSAGLPGEERVDSSGGPGWLPGVDQKSSSGERVSARRWRALQRPSAAFLLIRWRDGMGMVIENSFSLSSFCIVVTADAYYA